MNKIAESNKASGSDRIAEVFKRKKAFIAFITGGDPDMETTEKLIVAMAESGVDAIEIGIPFSDPIAEGIIIQKADERALKGGCTADKLFAAVKGLRKKLSLPLLFMTYINPIFVYGKDRFLAQCADCGIDGIIVPDLPFEEKDELADLCLAHGVCLISMIAPTSESRIDAIAKGAEGFLYCVSSLGVSGVRSQINTNVSAMIERVRQVSSVPCAIGFGISTPGQAGEMSAISDGVIVGSAIVKLVERFGRESVAPVSRFISEMLRGMNGKDC